MSSDPLFDPDLWCTLSFADQRDALATALLSALDGVEGVSAVVVEAGTVGREYDLTAMVETDVGRLRAPLWSDGRARIFCDPSVHPANRAPLAPGHAVKRAAAELRPRLSVRFTLESRGLTLAFPADAGAERSWTAERSRFRNRTAVTREDRVLEGDEGDLRDLLARFYSGPSLRASDGEGTAFLLREASDLEGPLVTLCQACGRWAEGAAGACPHCGGPADVVVAARPPRRTG